MEHVLDAVLEIFAWVGIGGGLALALLAAVLRIADGTWAPVHVVIDDSSKGRVARWFDDGGVGEAVLTPHLAHELDGDDEADLYARRGSRDRVRLTRTAPGVRFTMWIALALTALGIIALVSSWALLFARG
ncbi:hypothetical protein [Microbacterium sp.]|jgi:hypothetical protein|uniref:hypothetical protein n=1 Tax=Microbacterium sp. TaxID=51671 RepID=UPI002D0D8752|nr:hypothetical protein [Microbacterium sp.]HWL77707.1 hypothetical protein [Microbacterium sp.]